MDTFLKYWELKKQQYCPKVLIVPLSVVIGGQKSFLCNKRSKSKEHLGQPAFLWHKLTYHGRWEPWITRVQDSGW